MWRCGSRLARDWGRGGGLLRRLSCLWAARRVRTSHATLMSIAGQIHPTAWWCGSPGPRPWRGRPAPPSVAVRWTWPPAMAGRAASATARLLPQCGGCGRDHSGASARRRMVGWRRRYLRPHGGEKGGDVAQSLAGAWPSFLSYGDSWHCLLAHCFDRNTLILLCLIRLVWCWNQPPSTMACWSKIIFNFLNATCGYLMSAS